MRDSLFRMSKVNGIAEPAVQISDARMLWSKGNAFAWLLESVLISRMRRFVLRNAVKHPLPLSIPWDFASPKEVYR